MKRRYRQRSIRTIAVMLSLSILAGMSGGGWNLAAETDPQIPWTPQTETEAAEEASPLLPVIVEEDITKRGEYEKHFLCDDGSYMAVSYPEPVHMQQNGVWVDIAYAPEADGQRLMTEDSGCSLSLAKASSPSENRMVTIEADGYTVSWTVEGQTTPPATLRSRSSVQIPESRKLLAVDAQVTSSLELTEQNREEITQEAMDSLQEQKAAVQAELKADITAWDPEVYKAVHALNEDIQAANQRKISAVSFASTMVEYPKALGEGTTLRYTMSPGKLKEEVVIETPDALDAYCVRMNTNGLTAVPDANKGIHLQNADGEDVVVIEPPLLYDAADEISRNVAVVMTQEGDTCVLTYTPDKEWLNDEARVWPVVIDPTVTSVTIAQQNQIDNYAYAGQTSVVNDSSGDLYVGYYTRGGTLREHRSFWRLDSLPMIPSGATISGASFNIRLKNGTSSMGTIELYKADRLWTSDSLVWGTNMPYPSSSYLGAISLVPSGTEKWLRFTASAVTTAVNDWYCGHRNNGFILKYSTCVDDYNVLYSSDYRPEGETSYIPYITVSYVDTIPVSQVCLSPSNKSMNVGDTFRLSASVLPSNATNKGIIYSTSNAGIASVDPRTGTVIAVSPGTATITATSASNGSKYDSCTVTVMPNSYASLILGDEKSGYISAGMHYWYTFTPAVSGDYTFASIGNIDTYGELYQGSTRLISDDDAGISSNFLITHTLTANTEYRLKVRGLGSSTTGYFTAFVVKDDPNETNDNSYDNATPLYMEPNGTQLCYQKISYGSDVDWFKVFVPSTYATLPNFQIELWLPDNDTGSGYAKLKFAVYTNPSAGIQIGAASGANYQSCNATIPIDDYIGNKWFYIKVESISGGCANLDTYQLNLSYTDGPCGGEIYGWDYRGFKRSPKLNYRMSTGMNNVWKNDNGVDVTYAELFEEAIGRWNALDLKGDGTPMFGINDNLLSPNVQATELPSGTNALNIAPAMDIKLNINNFPSKSRLEAVDTICHELGHSLGLDDLYVDSTYGYTDLDGNPLNNSDHLMFGYGGSSRHLSGTGTDRFHSEDKLGVNKVQGWLEMVHYTEDELTETADLIVRGKVINTKDYEQNALRDNLYTRVTFEVNDCLYARQDWDGKELEFLQSGIQGIEFAVDPLFLVGEEYLLYLHYDLYGELFVVGGPQGRFKMKQEYGEKQLINQMDQFVQDTMLDKIGQEKNFSIPYASFLTKTRAALEKR